MIEKSAEKGISISEYSQKATDVLRYTDVSGVENLVSYYFAIVEELRKKGYTVVEVTNTFSATNVPYRGINTLVKSNTGYVFELQFHTPQSLEVKEENHKLYEEYRLAKTTKERKKVLTNLMQNNADKIVVPKNIQKVANKGV